MISRDVQRAQDHFDDLRWELSDATQFFDDLRIAWIGTQAISAETNPDYRLGIRAKFTVLWQEANNLLLEMQPTIAGQQG